MPATEVLAQTYGERVQFVAIYTLEAHPAGSPSPYWNREWTMPASFDAAGRPLPQPATYAGRVALAVQCAQEAGVSLLTLVDEMDNAVWCSYGGAPNNAYLIGQDGRVVAKHGWYKPEVIEMALAGLLRTATLPTSAEVVK